jgi:predicted GH43/DUF377 family glycosyl hydrolase
MLIGSQFTQEYALESSALFNPSIVWHPDQSGLEPGSHRFVLSLRAMGEGNISSIVFRSGTIDRQHRIRMDERTRFVTAPEQVPNTLYDKTVLIRKLNELGVADPFSIQILSTLSERFTLEALQTAVRQALVQSRPHHHEHEPTAQRMLALAKANYEISYSPEQYISERVIFPSSPTELWGIEDARLVQFRDYDGSIRYYGTYTAFDGKESHPQLLETDDFLAFKIRTLHGPEARGRGFALFPRKVKGLFAMISGQDDENIYVMYTDVLDFGYTKELIAKPTYAWEFAEIGNCVSPIETEAGWLVLTHAVSTMRRRCIGAILLDLDDPSRVIGRLAAPLLEPDANEREGSVPNTLSTCGAVVHDRELVIPYSMSDYASTFATISLDELLNAMVRI